MKKKQLMKAKSSNEKREAKRRNEMKEKANCSRKTFIDELLRLQRNERNIENMYDDLWAFYLSSTVAAIIEYH